MSIIQEYRTPHSSKKERAWQRCTKTKVWPSRIAWIWYALFICLCLYYWSLFNHSHVQSYWFVVCTVQAWDVLMEDRYSELRDTIYATKEEKKRFRQLIVNAVMATDITDQELKKQRNLRWEKAFQDSSSLETPEDENDSSARDRKATIVVSTKILWLPFFWSACHWPTAMRHICFL